MEFNEYQEMTNDTAIYPGHDTGRFHGLMYLGLKLNGEAGEVAEIIGKVLRDQKGYIFKEDVENIKKELGDVLWYVAQLAHQIHLTLEEVAVHNLQKLASRKQRGVLGGSGDDR